MIEFLDALNEFFIILKSTSLLSGITVFGLLSWALIIIIGWNVFLKR